MKKYNVLGEVLKFGALASVMTLASLEPAFAVGTADSVGDIMTTVSRTQVRPFATLLLTVAFVGGAVLLVSGALSLKKHADNPASEPMGKGIARLLVGGLVMALPFFAGAIQNSIFGTGAPQAAFSDFTNFSSTIQPDP